MTHTPYCPLPQRNALLLLEDGTVLYGQGLGNPGTTTGEICFNTAMTGYQEILTDPSYAGQIITFTFPHIGNVGTNKEDIETHIPHAKGLIIRNGITSPSSYRHHQHFAEWLKTHGIIGICGVDTRALTHHIRTHGAQNALIYYGPLENVDIASLKDTLKRTPSLEGLELATTVSTKQHYSWNETRWHPTKGYGIQENATFRVVAIDYGAKNNILRCLVDRGCDVTIVPGNSTFDDIMAHKPDGVFLSNGPGDPAATSLYAVPVIQQLLQASVPVFGICLGHQLLAKAIGAETTKMHQGHRGANHPVKCLKTGAVEITSQNHGFVVVEASLPSNAEITHVSLFDGSIEGIRLKDKPAFSVQYHPESSPGPHDSHYLFENFLTLMRDTNISSKYPLRKNA